MHRGFHSGGRPSQMNTYSSASLLYNMCSAFWVLLHSHKGFRYSPLGNTPAPQCTPTLSIYILEMVLVLIFAAGQTDVSAAHIWDQLPPKRTFNRHWTHCHHQQQYSAPRKHCWMEWGMRLNYKCVFSLDYSLKWNNWYSYLLLLLKKIIHMKCLKQPRTWTWTRENKLLIEKHIDWLIVTVI